MKIIINKDEYWISGEIPSNFDKMSEYEKWVYIHENKLFHREDGPAMIKYNGYKTWYLNGSCHRIDGPALIWNNGRQWHYLNGIHVDGETYKKIEGSSKEELLMYMILPKYKDYLPLIEYRLDII